MNKGYVYYKGEVIINDDKDRLIDDTYYDNLDEVLATKNLIEQMEKEIETLTKRINNEEIKKFFPKSIIIPILTIISTMSIPFLLDAIFKTNAFQTYVNILFLKNVNLGWYITGLFTAFSIPSSALIFSIDYSDYKKEVKQHKGRIAELKFLKKKIREEKNILFKLQKDRSRTNENTEFRFVNVNDIDKLKRLRDCLKLYYDLGYNEDKYLEYYTNGTIDEELKNTYTESDISLAKKYLKEKKLVLSKKNKR